MMFAPPAEVKRVPPFPTLPCSQLSRVATRLLVCALACVTLGLVAASSASAVETAVRPNGVVSGSGISDCATMWECVTDGNDATGADANTAVTYDLQTIPSVGWIYSIRVVVRSECGGTNAIQFASFQDGSGAGVVSQDTVGSGAAPWNSTTGAGRPTRPLTQTDMDGLRLYIRPHTTACPAGILRNLEMTVYVEHAPAVSSVIVPEAPRGVVGGVAPTGCTLLDAHACVDEDAAGAPDESDYLESAGSAFATNDFDLTTVHDTAHLTGVDVALRVSCGSGMPVDDLRVQLFTGASTAVSTERSIAVPAGGWSSASTGYIPVALTGIDLDAMWLRVRSRDCDVGVPTRIAAASVTVHHTSPNVTGFAYESDGVTPWSGCAAARNVTIVVVTTKRASVKCNPVTGRYTAGVDFDRNQLIVAYLDDDMPGSDGVTYARPNLPPTNPVAYDIGVNEVRSAGTQYIGQSDVFAASAALDPDIPVTSSSTTETTVGPDAVLRPDGGGFLLCGIITTPRMRTGLNGGISTCGSPVVKRMDVTGSGTGPCVTAPTAPPLCSFGTSVGFTYVRLTGSGTSDLPRGNYYGVEILPASGTPTYRLGRREPGAYNNEVRFTDTTIGDAAHPVHIDLATFDPEVRTSNVTIGDGSRVDGAGTRQIYFLGSTTGAGSIDVPTRPLAISLSSNQTSGPSGAADWTFQSINASGSSSPRTWTLPTGTARLRTTSFLQIGGSPTSPTTVLGAPGSIGISTGTHLYQQTDTTVVAPGSLDIGTDLTVPTGATFTANGGTVRFTGAGLSRIITPAIAFHALGVNVPGKQVTATAGATIAVTNALQLQGGACGSEVQLRSITAGSPFTLDTTGATVSVDRASIRDVTASPGITAVRSGDLGNTAGWTFGPASCPASTGVRVAGFDASAGLAGNIATGSAFPISSVNALPVTADRQRTRVVTDTLDGVVGLWHLDASSPWNAGGARTPDASTTGLPLETPTAFATPDYGVTAGPTGHGTGLEFGANKYLEAPHPGAAFDMQDFTVEAWFRTPALTNADPDARPVLVEHGNYFDNRQFTLRFDQATSSLEAAIATEDVANVKRAYSARVAAAPYVDDQWHHAALVVRSDASLPGPGELLLYVDGIERARTPFVGEVPNNGYKLSVGSGDDGAPARFTGRIDEVRISNVARSAEELLGYVRVRAAHATTIWETPGATGAAIAGCTSGIRCTNITYGGPVLADGARAWVSQQFRTTTGNWSADNAAPFGTSSSITVTGSGAMQLPKAEPGEDTTADWEATMTCNVASGCDLLASSYSDTTSLDDGGRGLIPRIPTIAPAAAAAWSPGDTLGFGVTVLSATSGKFPAWGSGTTHDAIGSLNYLGLTRTPTLLAATGSPGVEQVRIGGRLNPGFSTPSGTYRGAIVLTSAPNL